MLSESTSGPSDSSTTDNLLTLEDLNLKVEAVMEHVIEHDGRLAGRLDCQDARLDCYEASLADLRELVRQLLPLFAPQPCPHHSGGEE